MKFGIHKRLSDIPLDAAAWDHLVDVSGVGGIFLSHAWVNAWWQHMAGDNELYFITMETHGSIVGFAPLMLDTTRTLRFIGDLNSDYLGFVITGDQRECLAALMRFLVSRPQWRVMYLRNMLRTDLSAMRFPEACESARLLPWNNYSVAAPFLAVANNDAGVDALLAKYSMRRAEKQLADQGKLVYEVIADADTASLHWDTFAQQHIDRCHSDDRESPFSSDGYLSLLRSAFENDHMRDTMHFSVLYLDERPIAYHFGFISHGRLLWYKPSFDVSVKKGSPGLVMIRHLIAGARERGLAELDFTIGAEPFKDRFASGQRAVDSYRVHRSRLRYHCEREYWRARAAAKRLLQAGSA